MSDYDLLGLKPGATPEDAKRARNKLVRAIHPDRSKHQDSNPSRLAEINAAYDRILAGSPDFQKKTRGGRPQKHASAGPRFEDFGADGQRPGRREQAGVSVSERRHLYSNSSGVCKSPPGEAPRRSRLARDGTPASAGDAHHRKNHKARPEDSAWQGQESLIQSFSRPKTDMGAQREAFARQEAGKTADTHGAQLSVSAAMRGRMQTAIQRRMKQEAYRRATELQGIYPDPRKPVSTNRRDLPGFHMAEHIRFEGRTMQLHLREDAKEGRNIIAVPEMKKINEHTICQGADVTLFEISTHSGKGRRRLCPEKQGQMANASASSIEVVFGSALACAK